VGTAVKGVETTDGRAYSARAIVVTAGTFLRGIIHQGLGARIPAGRAGDSPSVELAQDIVYHGLTVQRFKTGTPPRIDGRTVELDRLERQEGDPGDYSFSFFERHPHPAQLPCYITHTGAHLRSIITDHLHESALYGGGISGRGPRYCPSIEDKVVRFPHAERHQVFLEPEGLDTTEMYVNGLSTSLPPAVQLEFLRSVPGLQRVEMTRPGYAIEYDYYPPTQLDATLKVKSLEGLYFAGQINGTTGYEEAAGQGAIAGLNAAAAAMGQDPLTVRRDQGFIGVLVDDLVTKGVDEPYRLFTSRAEFRLLLRQDNALRRLAPIAFERGLLTDQERRVAEEKLEREEVILECARNLVARPEQVNPVLEDMGGAKIFEPLRVAELAKRPGVSLRALLEATNADADFLYAEWADIELKYEGYLAREQEAARRLSAMDEFTLPIGLDYLALETISFEARERLHRLRPMSLGQAGRIPGVSPSDLQNLVLEVVRRR
jgi:tRNA uridine 5-carboxymethylaminomethyl modification enzyme